MTARHQDARWPRLQAHWAAAPGTAAMPRRDAALRRRQLHLPPQRCLRRRQRRLHRRWQRQHRRRRQRSKVGGPTAWRARLRAVSEHRTPQRGRRCPLEATFFVRGLGAAPSDVDHPTVVWVGYDLELLEPQGRQAPAKAQSHRLRDGAANVAWDTILHLKTPAPPRHPIKALLRPQLAMLLKCLQLLPNKAVDAPLEVRGASGPRTS
mmetsp:Transcript_60480/g.153697  ORF Transcript_60480/g.153697 Transcript_60480/m.153697 type:complete len:208 (-) Transcript_60480:118-741(-)